MTTITISINSSLDKFIDEILLAKQEAKDGKLLSGNLDTLAKGF